MLSEVNGVQLLREKTWSEVYCRLHWAPFLTWSQMIESEYACKISIFYKGLV